MKEENRMEDDLLESVTGGIDLGMEHDPVFRVFSDFWNNKQGGGDTGMESRTAFLSAFRSWFSDGMPKDIAGWYARQTGKRPGI